MKVPVRSPLRRSTWAKAHPDAVALALNMLDLALKATLGSNPQQLRELRALASSADEARLLQPTLALVLDAFQEEAHEWSADQGLPFRVSAALPSQPEVAAYLQKVVDRERFASPSTPAQTVAVITAAACAWALLREPSADDPAPPRAEPLDPSRLADRRAKLVTHLRTRPAREETARLLSLGQGRLIPLTSLDDGARVLHAQEADRLSRARLFHVDDEMTQAAIRRAGRGRKDPLSPGRVPARRGFLALGTPIRPTSTTGVPAQDVIAVSWGPWHIDTYAPAPARIRPEPVPTASRQPYWVLNSSEPRPPIKNSEHWWWITLWSQAQTYDSWPLSWQNEFAVDAHAFLNPLESGPTSEVIHTVVACWDFMTQHRVSKSTMTEQTEQARRPSDLRSDRRTGIEDNGTVHLVTLRGRLAPDQTPASNHKPVPTGHKLDYRMEIDEFDRAQCPNPRRHAELGGRATADNPDGHCIHEPVTVSSHIRGPEGAPLRIAKSKQTVYQLTSSSGVDTSPA
jgi:hypothetical protein